jgi:UPF0755 protein
MEDKTGVFSVAKEPDRHEEDALASILAKRTSKGNPELEKTAVIDNILAGKKSAATATKPPPEPEESEEDGQPFYVDNSAMKKAKSRRKKARIREREIRRLNANQSKKTFIYVFVGILLVVFIVSVSAFLSYYIIHFSLDFTGITRTEVGALVDIPPNSTTEEIAEILEGKGIITQPGFFVLYSQLFGHDGKYLDGSFYLENSMSYSTIIRTLQSITRTRETVMVTIPEGITAEEIGRLLEENHVCLASDFALFYNQKQNIFSFERRVVSSNMKFHQLEGYLFPDTYEFFVINALRDEVDLEFISESDRAIITNAARNAANRLFDNFNSMITPELYKRMYEQGFTLSELITLASMVQAEADNPVDMRLVASVFINRLNNSETFPLLQSDPTTYYVRDFIRPNISQINLTRYQDLMDAYDTYITSGLPPGPINNPGFDAIMAVLEAPPTSYYYFCANILTREVFYARDYDTHQANLARVNQQMLEALEDLVG